MESYICNTQILPAGVSWAPSEGFPLWKVARYGEGRRLGLGGCWHLGHQSVVTPQVSITLGSTVTAPTSAEAQWARCCLSAKPVWPCGAVALQAPLSMVLQARILEWGCMPSLQGISSQPRSWTHIFCLLLLQVLGSLPQVPITNLVLVWIFLSEASGYPDDWNICCESY